MRTPLTSAAAIGLLAVSTLGLPACTISVDEHRGDDRANVDISTPLGRVSVKTGEAPDTGLAVYPDARMSREHGREESANVNVESSVFGVHVAAAKYESDDAPEQVLAFYRDEMTKYGTVTECKGDIDFDEGRPTCKAHRRSSGETQLVVGKEGDHRIASVKPRGDGTELALVHVRTRGES